MATKKRRLNGDGSFKKRKNGTWEYKISIPGQYDKSGKQIRISTYGRTQTEAREKAQAKINQYQTGTVYTKDNVTIPQLARTIADEKLHDGTTKQQSFDREIETVKCLDALSKKPIQKITVADLRDYCNDQRKYSDTTIKKIYQMLGRVYKEAVKRNIIPRDLMQEVKKPRSEKPTKKVRALTIAEEKCLISALNNNEVKYSDVMLISLFTGVRTGEALALQVCDINYNENMLHIYKTVSTQKGAVVISDNAKTEAGNRDIKISDELCTFFHALTDGKESDDYLFTKDGHIIGTNTVYNYYKNALKKYDILTEIGGKKVTLHSLRHTYATRCIESGMQAKVLQHRLGHKNIQTTYDIYGDVFAQYEDACVDAADEYMKSIGVQMGYAKPINPDTKGSE